MNTTAGGAQRRVSTLARPVLTRLWDIDVVGYERLPADGPAILCPNHISFLDSALLMLTLRRNICFVGKAEYMDSWTTKHIFPMMGMIPIERSNGAKAMVALDAAADLLERGELFGIFPEGTRSRDGLLHKGRTGAARLALRTGAPIYPVGIVGTDEIQPPDAKLPKRRGACRIEIGRPIDTSRHAHRSSRQVACRSITDEVMYEISHLTGREYVHRYAGHLAPSTSPDRSNDGSDPRLAAVGS